MSKQKVIIGMSGGVDSSVSAALLLEQGYDVEGLFMRNWDSATNNDILGNKDLDNDICPQEQDYQDALSVCNKLNIKLHRVDFVKEYWENVFEYFLDEYKKGRTPNPDIMCNKYIKFDAFIKVANDYNADFIAMGHYAKVDHNNDEHKLLRGIDNNKDQTYFLSQLSKKQLSKVLFPIGHLQKKEVREIAKNYDLITANKKDSTGICFIGERDFNKFLDNYLPAKEGEMRTLDGTVISKHFGLMYYTIGQRKGLGIGGLNGYDNEPWFAIGKELETNTLLVGQGFHHDYLYSNKCYIDNINWLSSCNPEELNLTAKFRYRQEDVEVKVKQINKDLFEVNYDNVRAVTPGQACVLYLDEECLGGGIIKEVYMNEEKRKY